MAKSFLRPCIVGGEVAFGILVMEKMALVAVLIGALEYLDLLVTDEAKDEGGDLRHDGDICSQEEYEDVVASDSVGIFSPKGRK